MEASATGAIRGLPITAEKLRVSQIHPKETIWATPTQIINRHMKGLVKVSALSADNDLRRLRLLYDRVEANVRTLQTLRINSESYGSF